MEKKRKKLNINSAIYVMIGIMLAAMLLVTILTATLRKDPSDVEVSTNEASVAVFKEKTPVSDKTDKADTSITEDTKPSDTEKNVEGAEEITEPDVSVSSGIRYYTLPVNGEISKAYEIDIPVYSITMNDYRAHSGVDICTPVGTAVVSVEKGTVCRIWDDPMMGKCISIDHGDGIVSTYMNLDEEIPSDIGVGTSVESGQTVGAVGSSAITEISEEPHLHLEMKVNGELVDPIEYMGVDVLSVTYED